MTDCANVEMRELLPDLVHERLGSAEAARVQAHVSECAECTAELELIRAVMASAPAAPTMDVATIVAALPQPGARTEPTMQPSIARDGRVLRFGVRQLPLAAALALAASLTFVIVRRENPQSEIRPPVAVQAPVRPSTVTAPAKTVPGTTIVSKPVARVTAVASVPALTLGGETQDLSDESLAILVDEIERMDAVPGAEPESLEPSLGDDDGSR